MLSKASDISCLSLAPVSTTFPLTKMRRTILGLTILTRTTTWLSHKDDGGHWSVLPVDEAGEQLRLVARELGVGEDETLQSDGELDIATPDHVLNLKVFKLSRES